MSKTTGIVLGLIILAFGGLLTWSIIQSQAKTINYDQYDSAKIIPPDDNNGNIPEHVRGNAESPIVLVEYGDMQCAGCATAMPRITKLQAEYGDRVAFVFRNFPIQGHPNARAAAAALESAGLQGYFWEMIDTLYANQALWSAESGSTRTNTFANLFQNIAPDGDIAKFKEDLGDINTEKKITFDYNIGNKLSKVLGTPAFYINGESIDISESGAENEFLELFRTTLDRHLKELNLPTGPATNETEE
ncbi:MAG: DsbA family protein [Candidatus Nomurabacteria bacterium]|jgi:protein-disulfide isomerase|nr:DsbA family protein [Candidatus Nomurabacteria bacterium]